MGTEPPKKKSPTRVSAQDIEIYRLATEEGITHEGIAENYGICEATVSRTVKRVRTYLRELRELQLDERGAAPNVPATTAARPGGAQDIQLIPRAGQNILDQVSDFAKISHASASAGVVVGCAADSILDGLTNPDLSDEDGLQKTVNGFASLGGFIFGAIKSAQRLQETRPIEKRPVCRDEE